MSATWTCICGKTFGVSAAQQGELVACPACEFVLGEALPNRFEPATTVQAEEPTPRAVLANPEVLVQTAEPRRRAGPGSVDDLAEPDIRTQAKSGSLAMWLTICVLEGGLLVFILFMGSMGGGATQQDAAHAQTRALTQICDAYFRKHQKFPDNLALLAAQDEFGQIHVNDPDALLDPWGRPYQYDKNGPKHNGMKPDIWTVAPDGTVIGNFTRAMK